MKILLVQPSHHVPGGRVFKAKRLLFPVLTMPTIASYTPPEHDVEIVNDYVETIDYAKDYDLVAITAKTIHANRAYSIADDFRRRGKPVVMGGMHVSALPDEALQHCDSVVIGEAESTWPALLKDFESGALKPRYRSATLHDLKGLPVPRYDLLKSRAVLSILPYQTTRGCPHNCDFCTVTNFYGRSFRMKPVDEVIAHLAYIKQRYKPGRFFLSDDNICANPKYAYELFEKLIPLKIKWNSQADIHIAKRPDLLALARRSGCTNLYLGIESINQDSLDSLGKSGNHVDRYAEVFRTIKASGIYFETGIILGADGDDSTTFGRTLEFVNKMKIPYPTYSVLTPFPGTRLRDKLKAEDRVNDTSWDCYDYWQVNFKPVKMTTDELVAGQRGLFKKTYSLPSILKRCTFPLPPNAFQAYVQNFYNFWKLSLGKQIWE